MDEYILSQKADEDLISIYEYTLESWGFEQFILYSRQIESALRTIVNDPECTGSVARSDLAEGCRCYRVQHHLIVYRCEKARIEVARILHERMDFNDQKIEQSFPF